MDVTVRDRHDPRRCAFCHDALELSPARVAGCGRCGAFTHLACWTEHGACPVFGCAAAATGGGPRVVAWSEFVSEADAWLEGRPETRSEVSSDDRMAGPTPVGGPRLGRGVVVTLDCSKNAAAEHTDPRRHRQARGADGKPRSGFPAGPLALGAALDERAWGPDSPVDEDGPGSGSTFTSSQAA